jgi:hypothetical protein
MRAKISSVAEVKRVAGCDSELRRKTLATDKKLEATVPRVPTPVIRILGDSCRTFARGLLRAE